MVGFSIVQVNQKTKDKLIMLSKSIKKSFQPLGIDSRLYLSGFKYLWFTLILMKVIYESITFAKMIELIF